MNQRSPRTPRMVRTASVAVGCALLLSGCGGGDDGAQQAAAAADLVHVHGLGASADGLYVATHHGLYEVVGDEVRAVGDASHDLMGFTVAGPDDLLASGHPDLSDEDLQVEGKPPLLGLVHSADGHTWEPLSLLGEADFHSLEAAHGQVYGFDGTTSRFMVSDDRRNWDVRAEQLSLVDFAVSPDDPDVIVATTQQGIVRSSDGGRTWGRAGGVPLVFVDWGPTGLYGVGPAGQVRVSEDGGRTWQTRGAAGGHPQALYVADEALYVAVAEKGIVRSDDGGESFVTTVEIGA